MNATEAVLRQSDFKLFQDLMYEHAGIRLSEKKFSLVQNRLRKRLAVTNKDNYREYYNFISDKRNAGEFQHCVNALTTNETFFFRHKHHWDFLRETVLADWKKNARPVSTFKAWSAASSTGEEPYSLAILLYDQLTAENKNWRVEVQATDINHEVIDQARKARYGEYSLQKLTKRCLKSYFTPTATEGQFDVISAIRNTVSFKLHNLQQQLTNSPSGGFDIIFLRNVMIYFDDKSKLTVLTNVTKVLKPGGYLFLGGAETLSACQQQYQYIRPTIYRKNSYEQ